MRFDRTTRAVIYGRQTDVAQRMLDFDTLAGREPSVAALIDPTLRTRSFVKLFHADREIAVPILPSFDRLPEDVRDAAFLNFASFRSAPAVSREALASGRFAFEHIVAEGIPERETRLLIVEHERAGVTLLGPATVGGIAAGAFRVGNTGGSLENVVLSRLHRPGSVGFVSRSGGMSNEMYRVLSRVTDGVKTGFALGGDRYVGMRFIDAFRIFEADPDIRMIVLLGEVGGADELAVVDAMRDGSITKPVVAWVAGGFAEYLSRGVQFGHAGARANKDLETAGSKNRALREAGASVPESYADFENLIGAVYAEKVGGTVAAREDVSETLERVKRMAKRRGSVITSTISDERGEELTYDGIPVGEFIGRGGFARVIGHLWLKREFPQYALELVEMIMVLLADHGPAVSGAANTIATTRAGKDLVTSLIAGLATVGPRFGGAIDGAGRCWFDAVRSGQSAADFVATMKKEGRYIPGIGHKVKSRFDPDARVRHLLDFSERFPVTSHRAFALEVESLTLEKKPNLILNVDGAIAALLLDVFIDMGMTSEEIDAAIESGIFNAFFILSRTIGFIGHSIDQRRLGEGLYRTPYDDILYTD